MPSNERLTYVNRPSAPIVISTSIALSVSSRNHFSALRARSSLSSNCSCISRWSVTSRPLAMIPRTAGSCSMFRARTSRIIHPSGEPSVFFRLYRCVVTNSALGSFSTRASAAFTPSRSSGWICSSTCRPIRSSGRCPVIHWNERLT
jgi:hypothetical protein